ncbi:monovalent cation/H+ antiporter subunit A [Microvirga guangxiensis]|uniref:Multisubunit potassium/proton antiporter, PhaA subunit (TC 2.A.63.1.1)/multisubunit potassium/proton antiporter, PhaB subunit (TC 2.A.63.1.1) n=1 Tax=Microvirga guangxiensis TaxID=549386 RepID=A0A1G5I4A0_9HYPH|nr:monovalent cation/H+ antiporter subunit A [Microvirga guangxiensis]SCY70714.1 multisubunit potassium/proton antiporter, PhaA subunit (TC 2.A.63.1.1)/multisubunit potassium/proton antiporter, PhaB subunit (TC 2.A.63.1.1) [Microvirga guangxiensis]
MSSGMPLLAIVVLPFIGSLVATFLRQDARNGAAFLAGTIAFCGAVLTAAQYPAVGNGRVLHAGIEWIPSLGLNFTLRMDGYTWLFTMLVTGIGFLVALYARYYMSPADPVPRFFAFLLAFMGAMLGIVLSGNLIQLVFFWELTSLFSFLLIGYWHHNASARDGARMALTVTATGGLCLLVGVLLIGHIVGSYDLDKVLASGDLVRGSDLYLPTLILVLLGALTKSAQFPFHFWLPHAMAAPTPVSAYLHSATMVKAGVFLLTLLWPVLSGTEAWFYIVVSAGLCTLLLGSYAAIFQQDLKGLLAYSTISHLGLITLLLGLGSPLAAVAAIFHTINHATFKASLFMAAGIIDHESGTRDIRRLSGLFRYMPITATLAMVAAAAMAGVPLLNGFLSKEMFFAEAAAFHVDSLLDQSLPYFAMLFSAFSVTYSLRFIHGVFFGPPAKDLPRIPHEPPHWMRFPIELLVLVCLLVGILPAMTIKPFLSAAVHAVLGPETPYYSLAVWHGFNEPLLMSLIALTGGIILYWLLQGYLAKGIEGPPLMRRLKGQRIFERLLVELSWRWARSLERLLGTQRLQPQLRLLVAFAVVASLWPLYRQGLEAGSRPATALDPAFLMLWIVGGICAIGAAYQAKFHRLAAMVLLGGAGLVTCITFVWFSAPDLAITQLLVEIVTTVLILLGLRWLPKRIETAGEDVTMGTQARVRRMRDLMLALAAGIGMSLIVYAMLTRPLPDTISRYFIENAYSEGGGRNVVNVILVDFRGFDTFGEIVVLAVVAITVFSLLRRFRPAPESVDAPEQQQLQDAYDTARPDRAVGDTLADYLTIPSVIMQWLFPVIIVVAIYLFLRGHDLPGGGFAAGVTMSIALILQYMAGGTRWIEARLRIRPIRWMGLGLLCAVSTGIGAWVFGYPFLTSYFQYVELPAIGKVPAATALLFDFGVFSVVVGATVLILIALAHQSLRTPRAARPGIPAPPPVALKEEA